MTRRKWGMLALGLATLGIAAWKIQLAEQLEYLRDVNVFLQRENAKLERETDEEIADCAYEENHEVHGHGMRGVLAAGEARFYHCKAALEEEDHERADHYPRVVCAKVGFVCGGCNVIERFRPGGCNVPCAGWIGRRGLHREKEQEHSPNEGKKDNDGKDGLFH